VAFTKNAIELGVNDCIIWGGRLSEQDFDLKMQNSMFTFAVYTAPVSGSNIITRAMANATPVIATNIGVAPEYRGDFLFLIPSDDSEALALAISKLEKNPTMRANMSNSARRQSYRYSWETISDMNLAVYLDVLKKT
jgi:glycosyltransferase involved in cell wall biosynthesis